MRILFVILDGLADRPQVVLGGKTPLDAAHTPHLDRLAERGTTGLLTPLAPGVPVESDTAHFLLFGYDLGRFPGRAAFEAIGRGIDVPAGSVVLLASFAQTSVHGGTLRRDALMWATARGRDEADCDRLAHAAGAFETHGVRFHLEPCGRGEAILTLTPASGENVCPEISRFVSDVDPFYDGASVARCQPLAEAPRAEAAQRTADALNVYLGWAHARLSAHEVNRCRTARGATPINFLLTKWAGVRPAVPPFIEQNGLRAASVEDYPLYVGLARVCGLTPVGTSRRNSSDAAADFGEKLGIANDLFGQGYEFVHVHSKAPDVAAHKKDPRAKQRAIEALDSALEPLAAEIGDRSDRLVVVTGDHATPSSGPLIHSGEAVPLLIVGGPNVLPDDVTAFSERAAVRGGLGHVRGRDVMPLLLNYSDRARLHGVRHESVARPYWQPRPVPFGVDDFPRA